MSEGGFDWEGMSKPKRPKKILGPWYPIVGTIYESISVAKRVNSNPVEIRKQIGHASMDGRNVIIE